MMDADKVFGWLFCGFLVIVVLKMKWYEDIEW